MLRKYLLQCRFNLSDEGEKDAIYDSYSMRKFVRIDFFEEDEPNAATLLKFRPLLEENNLNQAFFEAINRVMVESGHIMKSDAIVDATIIDAPNSTEKAGDKMKLSIVIPVYNAENSICTLLDSVLCSKEEFEVICVNDGSTDHSVSTIEKYNDRRIKVLTKQNEGTFKAWQYGVKNSTGDYITIFDQDDYIDKDYLEDVFHFIDAVKADILFTPYYIQTESGEKSIREIGIEPGLYCGKDLKGIGDKLLGGRVPYAKFTKVVKRGLYERQIENTYNGQLRDFEDWLTMLEIFAMAESIYISNRAYYHYIQHSNSVSKSMLSYRKNYESLMKVLDFVAHNARSSIGERNYNSFCFNALNIMLGKCLAIGEYDLAKEVLNLDIYHNNVMSSDLCIVRRIALYTKSIWGIRLFRKIRGEG